MQINHEHDDLIGKTVFKWTIIRNTVIEERPLGYRNKGKCFLCKCSCGREKIIPKIIFTEKRDSLCNNEEHRRVGA